MSDEQDDKERGEWLHALSHIHEGEHAELEFARTWADSVEVDYDEGPCAIGFTKNGATYWYLIDDVGWDADDPRSEMLAAALAERNDLRTQLTIALRERDEARVECERLRNRPHLSICACADTPLGGYGCVCITTMALEARARETAEAIAAFVDAEAETRREEGFSYRAVSELAAAIRSNAWRPSPATDKEEP